MTITARAVGAWAAVNATTQTVTLPTHAVGDMLIVRAVCKPFSATITCSTGGWTAVAAQNTNGSTANGVGVGSMAFRAFYKIATSAAETSPVIAWGTTADPGAAVAVAYRKGLSEEWVTPTGDGGGDTTARTSQTSTIDTHVSVVAGDVVDFYRAQPDDSGALTVPTITQTGVTYDTVTEYPATALLSGTGSDIAADAGYRTATAGPSSAAAVVTGTSAASEEHGAWMTRLRVSQAVTLDVLDANPGSSNYAAEVVADSPVAYWKLNEASGSPQDSVGTNHVTATGGTPDYRVAGAVAGDPDTAIGFVAASSEYFTAPDVTALDLGDGPFTIEFWVRRASSGTAYRTVVDKGLNSPSIYFDITTNKLTLEKSNVAVNVTESGATADTLWHHFAVVRPAGGPTVLYKDGANVTALVGAQTFVDTSVALHIGATQVSGPRFFMDGRIDELAIYKSALSGARVSAHYAASGTTAVARLYAPDFVQVGAQSITVPLLDAAPALYAPSVGFTLTVPLLDAANALYAPTVGLTLTVPLLTSTATLYAPTIAPQPVTLTIPALDAGNALYAPSVGFTITLATLDAGNALYAPVAYLDQFLTPPLLDGAPAVYAPTVVQAGGAAQDLTVPLLDASGATYAPTITTTNAITLALLDSSPALYAPTVAPQAVTITLGQLDAANTVYGPTITPAAWPVIVPYLDGAPTVYAPAVIPDQFLTPPLLDGAPALYAPTLVAKSSLTVPLLDSGPSLYAPAVIPDQFVTLDLIDSGPALYTPTITAGGTMALQFIDSGATLYAPTVAPQAVGVTVPQLDGLAALYAPSITAQSAVTLGLLDGLPALYAPTVTTTTPLGVPLLTSTSALYAPTLAPQAVTITIGLLDGVPELYTPTFAQPDALEVPFLDGDPALYAPALVNSWTVPLPLLESEWALYPPILTGGINLPIADLGITDIDPGDLVVVASGTPIAVVSVASVAVGVQGATSGVVLSVASGPVAITDIEVG